MLLVIGSTGTLGLAFKRAARARGLDMRGAARHGADLAVDVGEATAVHVLIKSERPSLVINCTAVTDVDACERDVAMAARVNAEAPGTIAVAAREVGARFVHISTDHFFTGDGTTLHDEAAPITLVNEYARSKFAGEVAALRVPGTLAVRTNLTGWRGWPQRPTFIEWAIGVLERQEAITGFSDFVTSTIDADTLANAILDLVAINAEGLLNVAACEAIDKAAFLRRLAEALGVPANRIRDGSVRSLVTTRAESLGLDVRKAETTLGRRLPGLNDVVAALVRQRPELKCVF